MQKAVVVNANLEKKQTCKTYLSCLQIADLHAAYFTVVMFVFRRPDVTVSGHDVTIVSVISCFVAVCCCFDGFGLVRLLYLLIMLVRNRICSCIEQIL